jgi:peptidoglycan/LPS O-acetylase OafA/YrhL
MLQSITRNLVAHRCLPGSGLMSLPQGEQDSHIPWLDGLRGIAALWVLLSHVQILTGMRGLPLLSWGGVAVDLFMMLSGFLMAHHYLGRRTREPWHQPHTIAVFWTRRFFRIAPLYYVLLVIALIAGPALGEMRDHIAAAWPQSGTDTARYTDQSLANLTTHLSFAFGMLPTYAFRTPLPDWSIGLEMQFYLAFPFMMLLAARLGAGLAALLLIAACALGEALAPGFFSQFPMPAFLPIKLYVFLAGMLMAFARRGGKAPMLLASALFYPCVEFLRVRNGETLLLVLLLAAMFYLTDDGKLPGAAYLREAKTAVRRAFAGSLARFLGSTSYATYLLHLLIVLPTAGTLAQFPAYVALNQYLRFAIVLALVLPIVYLSSWLLYQVIEQPGIKAGKMIVRRWKQDTAAVAPTSVR